MIHVYITMYIYIYTYIFRWNHLSANHTAPLQAVERMQLPEEIANERLAEALGEMGEMGEGGREGERGREREMVLMREESG